MERLLNVSKNIFASLNFFTEPYSSFLEVSDLYADFWWSLELRNFCCFLCHLLNLLFSEVFYAIDSFGKSVGKWDSLE